MSRAVAVVRNYAELGRVSNLPTCISNVMVGCVLGAEGGAIPGVRAVAVAIGVALLYVGGMALNDAVDVQVDRVERPGRVIPSGRISLRAAYVAATCCLAAGVAVCAGLGIWAVAFGGLLAAAIVVYNLTHKRSAAAVVLMGLCRGLVYFVAASAIAWPLAANAVYWLAVALSVYVLLLSLVARGEAGPGAARRWVVVLEPLVVLLMVCVVQPHDAVYTFVSGIVLLVWLMNAGRLVLRGVPKTVPAVLSLLAGICLVDAYFLTLLDRPAPALAAGVCFLITVNSHRHIIGT